MSYESVSSISLTAGAAVAARRFVKIEAATGASIQAAGGTNADEAIAISLEAAADGDTFAAAKMDGAKVEVESGGVVALGADVTADADGKAVAAATGTGVNGFALTASAADGEIITIVAIKGSLAAP